MVLQERLYTAEDLWELSHSPEYSEQRLELSKGILIVMAPASFQHGKWMSKWDRIIGDFVEANDLGETTGAETGYILFTDADGRDTVRAPDVAFVAKARIPAEGFPERGFAHIAPDLAVEVVSPNDTAEEVQQKVNEYLEAGTRAVWVFYPKPQTIAVHTRTGTQILRPGDVLDGGDVLPGFTLALRDLFRDEGQSGSKKE
jgi:Uma2 family endonuclease